MSLLQKAQKEASKYVLWHYGNMLSVEDPIFDEKENVWKIKLKSDYPRLIKNEYPEERFVRALILKDLGTIVINEEFQVIKNLSTQREKCLDTLRTRLKTWQEKAESIIVKTSSMQLANTSFAGVFLNPVKTILANFLEGDSSFIAHEELDKLRERYSQWASLLAELDLIRDADGGYKCGNTFVELRRISETDEQFLSNALAYVIKERYDMLKDIFGLKQLEPLVHLDSCYYVPALEAGKVLFRTKASLFSQYLATYKNRNRLELPHVLYELCTSSALRRRGNYYSANEELFEEMLPLSEKFLTISSPQA